MAGKDRLDVHIRDKRAAVPLHALFLAMVQPDSTLADEMCLRSSRSIIHCPCIVPHVDGAILADGPNLTLKLSKEKGDVPCFMRVGRLASFPVSTDMVVTSHME